MRLSRSRRSFLRVGAGLAPSWVAAGSASGVPSPLLLLLLFSRSASLAFFIIVHRLHRSPSGVTPKDCPGKVGSSLQRKSTRGPARKAPRRTTTTGEGGGGITTTAAANYKTAGSMAGRASGKQLGTGTSTSPDPETLLSAAGAAGAAAGSSGRPGSSSRERPGSRGSTTTTATATATATATQPAASRPPGIGLGGYTQKQLDEWHDQCDITDSHKEIKPHKTVTVDGKGQHFVGRQVAWSPEGNWCVVVGNSNRAMIFQRWGK